MTKGRHIHIGILSADVQARLHHELAAVGVEPARFIHVSWVSSVAQALVDYNVDLYISSFPLGGGKTTVEAMAAGTPLLMHQNYNSRFLGAVDLAYPDAWVWRSESELIDIISTINLTDLERHSHLAKAHYKKYHSEKVLVDLANFLNFPKITEIPKLKEYSDDPLQTLLDENAIDGCIAVQADQSENETDFLLSCAQKNKFIKGVIGWLDLTSDNLESRLNHYTKNPLFKGG